MAMLATNTTVLASSSNEISLCTPLHGETCRRNAISAANTAHNIVELLDQLWFGVRIGDSTDRQSRNVAGPISHSISVSGGSSTMSVRPLESLEEHLDVDQFSDNGEQSQVHKQSSTSEHRSPPTGVVLAAAVEQLELCSVAMSPVIGTWADRMVTYKKSYRTSEDTVLHPFSLHEDVLTGTTPSPKSNSLPSDNHGGNTEGNTRAMGTSASNTLMNKSEGETCRRRHNDEDDDQSNDSYADQAWRWRFSRRWQAELQRAGLPRNAASISADDPEGFIEYARAYCGGTSALSIPRNKSRQQSYLPNSASIHENAVLLGSDSSASLLLFDPESHQESQLNDGHSPIGSVKGGGGGGGGGGARLAHKNNNARIARNRADPPSASRDVNTLAVKGWHLLKAQERLEEKVDAQWKASRLKERAWVGLNLLPVQIDRYGRFKFAVIRVSDGMGRSLFVLRGKNGCTPVELAAEVAMTASMVSKQVSVAPANVELWGAGTLEWREDTGRHLTLAGSPASEGFAGGEKTNLRDVTGLAASLLRQDLPSHYQIQVAGTV